MNFIIPYYCDERLKYTQKYLKKAGYNEVFDKSEANFAVFAPACDKEMFKGYENVHVFYGVGDYDKKYKNCYDYNKRDDFKYKNAILTSEGAIALYKENSNKAIYGSNILITGFGKIGENRFAMY